MIHTKNENSNKKRQQRKTAAAATTKTAATQHPLPGTPDSSPLDVFIVTIN
jgi:hypothetical protein